MTFIICAFPQYIRAINWTVGGRGAGGRGARGRGVKGKGVKGRGSTFYFKWSFIVLNIFIVIFYIHNRRTSGILR